MRYAFLCVSIVGLLLVVGSACPAEPRALTEFDLPAQPLADSLRAVGRRTSTNVLFDPPLVEARDAPALKASLTADEAFARLLAGTGLRHRFLDEKTVTVAAATTEAASADTASAAREEGELRPLELAQAASPGAQSNPQERSPRRNLDGLASGLEAAARVELEEIVVTGTNIRGVYPSSSPVETYTAEEIRRTGATTTEEFFRKLPQNLPSRTEIGPGSMVPANGTAVNSIDLRGLGVGTTLVLLNGRRMGLTANGQTVDISQIPMNAIARVEVLTDGASAIYGSDAIGGVINFVTRDDFEGAETRLGHAGTPSGGLRKTTAGQTFGHRWGSGNALISYDYYDAQPLEYADRSYTAPAGTGFLTPDEARHGALATFSQDLSSRITVNSDFAWSERKVTVERTRPPTFTFDRIDSERSEYFANLGADFALNDSLDATVLATYSSSDTRGQQRATRIATGAVTTSRLDEKYHSWDLTAKLDGDLFALPAGDVRFSLGGGYTDERFEYVLAPGESGRSVTYAFAEVFAPLISPAQGISLAHRLEMSLAARYTRYHDDSTPPSGIDFEGDPSPKIGLFWAPSPSLGLRATWGESFRAASLEQTMRGRSFGSAALLDSQLGLPGISASGGPGGLLTPETATSYTVGFDFTPEAVAGLKVSGTYFNISYEDRIGRGVPNDVIAFANPSAFPELFNFAPTVAEIEALLRQITVFFNTTGVDLDDPAAAAAELVDLPGFFLYDARNRNLARSELDGVDLSASYALDLDWGDLTFGGQFTKILEYIQQNLSTSPVFSVVDTALLPVDLRGRAYAGFTRGSFGATLSVNYVDDYTNNLFAAGPSPIDSWTTVDMAMNYSFGDTSGIFEGVRLDLSIQNLFDQDPPFVATPGGSSVVLQIPVGFDPANANPTGRFVALSISKTW